MSGSATTTTTATAEILTIGDELNRGEIVDTNSAFLAERLTELGVHVRFRSSVNDDPADMVDAVRRAAGRAQVVVASGGLGPTEDDRTVDVVSTILGVVPEVDATHEARMQAFFAEHGRVVTPNNLRQVRVPKGAEVLANRHGLAPGFAARLGDAHLYFMPGVPREMRPMFEQVEAALRPLVGAAGRTAKRTWRMTGLGEAQVDHALAGLLDGIADATLHFRISFPETMVTVVVRRPDEAEATRVLHAIDTEVRRRLGEHIYGVDGETLPQVIGRRLAERAATLATAESCTGGLVGELITAVPGASAYYLGGVISYADAVKLAELGVAEGTLAAHGAVSEPVVREMA
jgi:nicotinamide-nucleotide amidase